MTIPPHRTTFFVIVWLLILSLVIVSAAAADSSPEIRIEGVFGALLDNVTEALQPPVGLYSDGEVNTLWLNRYIRLAPDKVKRALEPFGYYSAEVEVSVNQETTPLTVLVTIDPGAPVRIATRHLEIIGESQKELQERLARFPLTPGEILLHLPYEKAKSELQALAANLGYLDAAYSRHQIRVDRQNNSADLDLVLNTGPRFRFGAIKFTGGDEYPEPFLRRYIIPRQGEIFSFALLGKTQQQFLDSDRFQNILISPQREPGQNEEIPVEIRLKSKPPKRLRPGIGYGTDTGARAFLRYQDVNLWRLGHEFNTNLLIAERKKNLIGSYIFPGYRNIDTKLALHGGYQAEDLETYESRYIFTEVEQIYGLKEGKTGSLFLRFQKETSTFSGDRITTKTLMPGVRFNMGRLDDPIRPKQGYHLSLELRGAWEGLVSDISLFQAVGDIDWIVPLFWRTYLHLRGIASTSLQQNDFDELPASLRFFAGGDRSVRGYAYQSLGPTDDQGNVIGGKHLLVGSIELEKRFLENWGVAAFYDAGNAFNTFSNYELAKAAGVGLRYFTPVGPARIDLARTLHSGKDSYRVHIGLGVGW
jgi:translocation and assembly module TamA